MWYKEIKPEVLHVSVYNECTVVPSLKGHSNLLLGTDLEIFY
jgi:hypothetical protein